MMLVNAIVVFIIVSMLFLLEFILALRCLFSARNVRFNLCAKYEQIGAKIILGLFRMFHGFKISVRNPEKLEIPLRCLVISNHQSLLDIIVLISFLGIKRKPRFVAKRELQYGIPFVSFTLRKGGHCLIKREGAPLDAMREVSKMAKICAQMGACPVIFPEGTRSRNGHVGEFHTAGVRKLLESGGKLPVAAIALEGGWRVANAMDFLKRFGKVPYIVEIVKVYEPPRSKYDIENMLIDARHLIEERIEELRTQ
ncbi:MAG: 1-acyl-sn-glycerol-3-phosphate acyltransferase [Spirochaetes bacterium ADurb.Bin110]|nr:MAG: 1-acyl-sn-glycerol-3-phosphate acyltransferase [Spirochaetes bacterium ADurb.Bin110]